MKEWDRCNGVLHTYILEVAGMELSYQIFKHLLEFAGFCLMFYLFLP